jgi:hypothetical protein
VVAIDAPDDDLALRLAQQIPIAAHHAHIGVIAFAAAGRIKNVIKAPVAHGWRKQGQLGCQLGCRHVGGLKETVVVGQFHHLLVGGIGNLLAAIAHIHAPQAAHAVQNFFSFRVPDVNIISPGNHPRATGSQITMVGKRMDVMRAVHCLNGLGVNGPSPADNGRGRDQRGKRCLAHKDSRDVGMNVNGR